jgi:hypothetical protein
VSRTGKLKKKLETGSWQLEAEALFDNFVKNFTLLGPGSRRRTVRRKEIFVGFIKSPRFE